MRRRPPALRQPAIEAFSEPGAAARLAVNRQALVRVFLVCDVRVHRDLLSAALADGHGIELAGSAHGDVACLAVGMSEADVVLVDGGSVGGPATVRALAAAAPEAKIVVTGVPEDEGGVVRLVEAGIAGYATADQPLTDVAAAVVSAAEGELQCSPRVSAALAQRVAALSAAQRHVNGRTTLTPREREIAELIGDGLSNKQIARRLSIELATVKNHVHNILRKLGVTRRDQIVL
jgi:two-component system, NarL family, nitrate/nitrite response regulator NarL